MDSDHEAIRLMLISTDRVTQRYCDVTEIFFGQSLGERIEYNTMLDYLDELQDLLRELLGVTREVFEELENYVEVLNVLLEYQNILRNNMIKVQEMLMKFYRKSQGGFKYSYFQYVKDMKDIRAREKKRMQVGDTLNRLSLPFVNVEI